MQIKVVLYATFREKLPPEARGRTTLELPEGSRIADVLERLDIRVAAQCAVNGELERDRTRQLKDQDEVRIFRSAGGGGGALVLLNRRPTHQARRSQKLMLSM
ncbi:MAG: MoaD/ThiS family protein [Anaerolineales bacterium]|nr:MoaD/ThiS family protein [Anaerolineales bacterium]